VRTRDLFAAGGGSYLGIGVVEIEADRAKALKLAEERGVEVRSVEEDSPASKAGLKEGDVVLEYNGQRVEGTEQFVRMVRETPAGRQVRLLISRGGAAQTLTTAIGRRPRGQSGVFSIPDIPGPFRIDIPRPTMEWRSSVLGVESESLESQLAAYFGVKEGVLVKSVIKGSAADKAGVQAGDVIVKLDGARIATPRELSTALKTARNSVSLTVVRRQNEINLNVTLGGEYRRRGYAAPAIAGWPERWDPLERGDEAGEL
jgi:serine protease Do